VSTKASPSLQLKPAPELLVFRAFEQVLKNDPVVGRHINTLIAWHDEDKDLWEPSWSLCPYIRLMPYPIESDMITEEQHAMPLLIDITVAVQGIAFENISGFWAAIRNALIPEAIKEYLVNVGVTRPVWMLNGYGFKFEDAGTRISIAQGRLRLGMLITT
jgi:hypothetical protein